MPPRRLAFTRGQYYHLYNRGVARQSIFREPENYLYVLRLLKKYALETDTAVIAYCLMPNHYHILVRQNSDIPARLLPQRVFNTYTKAYNKRFERSGTLFEGRYQARRIDRESYLLHVCRYIHANPVKHGLVSCVDDWPYSNYAEWVGRRAGKLADRAFIATHFPDGRDYAESVAAYLRLRIELPERVARYVEELEA